MLREGRAGSIAAEIGSGLGGLSEAGGVPTLRRAAGARPIYRSASLAHQERMLRHLRRQEAAFPRTMSGNICSRCEVRYTRLDGSCICETQA